MGHGRITPMGALLLLVLPLTFSVDMEPCPGMPGIPGVPGLPGRDGRNGQKGDTGAPWSLMEQTDQFGISGEIGGPGATGKRGAVGEPGRTGPRGAPGPMGEAATDDGPVVSEVHSAFSVLRATSNQPASSSPISFPAVITNYNNDFNTDTGHFSCSIPGTYYFVYHASATDKLCVQLKLDGNVLASWCDIQTRDTPRQVSSGGLAVYLKRGQDVWLEVKDHRGMTSTDNGVSIFSGFLIHNHI